MQQIINSIIIFCFLITPCLSNVVLTDEEFNSVITQLEQNKKLIKENQDKWNLLRKAIPEIHYQIDNDMIIQKLTIPVEQDNPLEFTNKFTLVKVQKEITFFPFILRLVGGLESTNKADAKIGLKVFSLAPLSHNHIKNLGMNILGGIKSSAMSISYDLPQPFANTSIHIYYGFAYNANMNNIVGIGIGLNF